MYKVKLTNRAKKELKRIDKRYLPRVSQLIGLLKTEPFLGEKMSGDHQGSYRIKIPPLRIIYTPNFKNKTILIEAIGHRGYIQMRIAILKDL